MSVNGKTLSQTAIDVGVEPSTVKYWCEEFSNFIRPTVHPGGIGVLARGYPGSSLFTPALAPPEFLH